MPAVAVIRGVQALSGFTGRKVCVGGILSLGLNTVAQPWERSRYWYALKIGGGTGTASVAVKCVDISWNAKGEGRYLNNS